MIEDEKRLLQAIIEDQEPNVHKRLTVDEIADKLKMDTQRAYYFVNKWDFWEYGTSLRTGWIDNFPAAKEYVQDPDHDRRKI